MRDALILLLFCFICYPRLLARQLTASFEGTVVNSVTGARLNRVQLRLAPLNPDEVAAPTYGAQSNDIGQFSMAAIQPGIEYRLEADRAGFLLFPTIEHAPSGVVVRTFKQASASRVQE